MIKVSLLLFSILLVIAPSLAQRSSRSSGGYREPRPKNYSPRIPSYSPRSPKIPDYSPRAPKGDTYVQSYLKKDGTFVEGHYRSASNGDFYDNYSTKPNINPYTGKEGTKVTPPLGQGTFYDDRYDGLSLSVFSDREASSASPGSLSAEIDRLRKQVDELIKQRNVTKKQLPDRDELEQKVTVKENLLKIVPVEVKDAGEDALRFNSSQEIVSGRMGDLKRLQAVYRRPLFRSTVIMDYPKNSEIVICFENNDFYGIVMRDRIVGWVPKDSVVLKTQNGHVSLKTGNYETIDAR